MANDETRGRLAREWFSITCISKDPEWVKKGYERHIKVLPKLADQIQNDNKFSKVGQFNWRYNNIKGELKQWKSVNCVKWTEPEKIDRPGEISQMFLV